MQRLNDVAVLFLLTLFCNRVSAACDSPCAAPSFLVTKGKVLLPDGNPATDVILRERWDLTPRQFPVMQFGNSIGMTNEYGRFHIETRADKRSRLIIGFSSDQRLGVVYFDSCDDPNDSVTLRLAPTVRITGNVVLPSIKRDDSPVGLLFLHRESKLPAISLFVKQPLHGGKLHSNSDLSIHRFAIDVPLERYDLIVSHPQCVPRHVPLLLEKEEPGRDLGELNLDPVSSTVRLGSMAPVLKATDSSSHDVASSLESLRGNWILIAFWAYWCSPCVSEELPELVSFYHTAKKQFPRIRVIGVHCTKDVRTMEDFDRLALPRVRRHIPEAIPFVILIDGNLDCYQSWGITRFPMTAVVDPRGHIVYLGEYSVARRLIEEKQSTN